MRGVKFKGKRLDNGGWVEGDLTRRKSRFAPQLDMTYGISDEYGTFCAVHPATVGQYTGMNDIDGVEIYEGDVITFEEHKNRQVVFDQGGFQFHRDGGLCPLRFGHLVSSGVLGCEVIGNIHDNPEMLEAEQ